MAQQVYSITDFKGLGDPFRFGLDPATTRVMQNVRPQFGTLVGRDGATEFGGVVANGVALIDFKKSTLTSHLVLVTTSNVLRWDTGTSTWVTLGSTHSGLTVDSLIDSAVVDNKLYFCPEGPGSGASDQLHRWNGTQAGLTKSTASPSGKYLAAFEGFLMMGYAGATNSDAPISNLIRYADLSNVEGSWNLTKALTISQTPGIIQRLAQLGRQLFVYKSDGIVGLRFVGGSTQFRYDQVPFGVGMLAPFSLGNTSDGHIFLAMDGQLYLNNGSVQPLKAQLNNTLRLDLNLSRAFWSHGVVDEANSIYSLFYPGLGSTFLNKRLDVNYRSAEFDIQTYPSLNLSRVATSGYLAVATSPARTLVGLSTTSGATDDITAARLDEGITDRGAAIERFWTSDWTDLGLKGDKMLSRVDCVFSDAPGASVEVSVASDLQPEFHHAQTYGLGSHRTADDMFVSHRFGPVVGRWHNVKLRFPSGVTGSNIRLERIDLYFTPLNQVSKGMGTPKNFLGT